MILGVPTLCRYDLLQKLIASVEAGSVQPDRWVIVDNGGKARRQLRLPERGTLIEPGNNLGVAASWNRIVDEAAGEPVMIVNDDVTLGRDALASLVGLSSGSPVTRSHNWSLFVLRPECVAAVGYFDENFYPAYGEDDDYGYRMRLAGLTSKQVHVDSTHVHGASGWAERCRGPALLYFNMKWGGSPRRERYLRPFGGNPPAGWSERPKKRWAPRGGIIGYIYGRR